MLFMVLLQNYWVVNAKTTMGVLYSVTEPGEVEDGDPGNVSINYADENDGVFGIYFDLDAEIVVDENDKSAFSVTDQSGVQHQFVALNPADLTTPFKVTPNRDDPNRLNVQVGKFDVLLNHTDEGIIVDVWPNDPAGLYNGDSLGTVAVQNDDADEAMEPDPDAKWDAENGQGPADIMPRI